MLMLYLHVIVGLLLVVVALQGMMLYLAVHRNASSMPVSISSPIVVPPPSASHVQEAIWRAVHDVGLHERYLDPHADLLATGKLADVIYQVSAQLGEPIRTTDQLAKVLTPYFTRTARTSTL
jgi:hypothetical protein